MNGAVNSALPFWGLDGADWSLVATRENQVFKVSTGDDQHYALRLHRQAFRSDRALTSELAWMGALATGGLNVPRPVASMQGQFLHVVDGIQIDVLTWLPATPLGATGTPLDVPDRLGVFRQIGVEMARLHTLSDAWTPPEDFERWSWDRAGLVGERPNWGRFWDNPTLAQDDKALFETVRKEAEAQLRAIEHRLDFGLIHADMVRENIMRDSTNIYIIDFDDGGWGYRLFDVATFLFKNQSEPDFDALQSAFLDGYQSQRVLDTTALSLFMLLRALTYVGWIIERMDERGAAARNRRFVDAARAWSLSVLDG